MKEIISMLAAVALLGAVAVVTPSCTTSAARATYQTAATTTVSVEAAVRAYNVFAAEGKTTVEQNRQVKAAYEKYQACMAVLCDAGAVYAAGVNSTNASASAAMQQAAVNLSASINDVLALVRAFGVKI